MEETRNVEAFYEAYDEWSRLDRHKVEFEITKRYFDNFITEPSRILDIGGGPGRYSIHLTQEGHRVVLLDLTKKHIELAIEKAQEAGIELEAAIHGSALELDSYNLGEFDVTLIMGPLYHLTRLEDRVKVVEDTLKRLKPGGTIFASFISAYAPAVDLIKAYPEDLKDPQQLLKYLENGINKANEGFTDAYFMKPQEARGFMQEFGLTELAFVGVEGLAATVESRLNQLSQEVFDKWIEVLYQLSQDEHIFGSCEHYLYIGKR